MEQDPLEQRLDEALEATFPASDPIAVSPTTLGSLFPGHAPSQKVVDPVHLGGPAAFEAEVIDRVEAAGIACE